MSLKCLQLTTLGSRTTLSR